MAITGSDKIFVDVNDEINFVVEKVLASERERVILVVPQNAIIISSLVSMKILAKQLAKSKKQLILVSEDAFGLGLAERSGIVAVNKVSNIIPEMWEAAQIAKETLKSRIADTKKQLLVDRGAIPAHSETPIPAAESEVEPQSEMSDTEAEVPEAELEPETEMAEEAAAPEQIAEDEVPVRDADTGELIADEEDFKAPINRPRRDPKVVHVDGFEIMAGGDISRLSTDKNAIISGSGEQEPDMDEESQSDKRAEKPKPSGGFTGRDWTNYTGDKKSSFSLGGILPFKRQPAVVPGERRPIMPGEKQPGNKRNLVIGIVVALLVLFLGGGYVLAFQLNTVEIKVSLQTEQVPVQQAISADAALTAIDTQNLVIPAKVVTYDQLSISASDKATGEGKSGDKAAGLIDLWNFTAAAVSVPNGTEIQNTTTNLKYKIDTADGQDVSVPACSAVSGGSCTGNIGEHKDVHIVALDFGEDYNITESGTKQDFKITGFTTDQVEGKRFKKIEGGTTTTFTSVSQDDIDRVKKTLTENLEKQGGNKITGALPQGYRLIDGTQKFAETESSSDPKLGEKVPDTGNFSVSLKGKETALAVSEADLQQAISLLIANNQKVGSNFEINGLGDAVIGDVVRDGDKVTFTISSSGNLQSKVTADELKQNLAGKSLEEAENYLLHVDEIVSHKINYSPAIVPESLRRIPSDPARIKIVF